MDGNEDRVSSTVFAALSNRRRPEALIKLDHPRGSPSRGDEGAGPAVTIVLSL